MAAFGAFGVIGLAVLFTAFATYAARRMDKIEEKFTRRDSRRSELDQRLEHLEKLLAELVVTETVKDQHHRDTVATASAMSTVQKSMVGPEPEKPGEGHGG